MTGYVLEVAGEGPAEWTWADAAALGERAVPSAFERYYARARALLEEAAECGCL